MDNDSICFSKRDEAWQKQLGSKEGKLQVKDIEKILLEKDELIALLETLILEKKTTIAALENQNHELLHKMHAIASTSKLTERGETEKQVVNDLLGRSDKENSLLSTLPKPKWDGERLALENQVSNIHQEFKLLKSENSVKTFSNNLNGTSFIPYLAQEVNNGDMVNVQRNTLAVPEEHITMYGTTKVFEGRLDGEPYLSNDISEETAYIILESPLKSMSKEQLISHYIRVVAAMRRDKEILLAEKTEEIYRLKRNILREKGNESEIRILRRMLNDMTSKFDEVMKDSEKLTVSRRFADKNSGMISTLQDTLQDENRRMVELLTAKEREFKALYDSNELENLSREYYLSNQITELENEREEIKVTNRNEIDILRNYLEEIIKEKAVALNIALKECVELRKQKHSLEELIHDKDRGLSLVLMEKEDQKRKIGLMEKLIEQKENEHKELQGLLHKLLKECKDLKRKIVYIETLTLEKERALDSAKREKDELKKQVVLLEAAVEESRHCVDVTLRDLQETRKEKLMLEDTVRDRENTLNNIMEEEGMRTELEGIIAKKDNALSLVQREIEQKIKETLVIKESFEQNKLALEWAMVCIKEEVQKKHFLEENVQKLDDCITSMQVDLQMEQKQKQSQMELFRCVRNIMDATLKLEDLALEKLHHNFLRLGGAERQLIMLRGLANSFALRESYYRKMYEIKRSNLQKAEEEVDLLGDEVDSLVSLLEKIYCVLNHYAPILQHYPGILDLVKLIKKEIMWHADVEIKL